MPPTPPPPSSTDRGPGVTGTGSGRGASHARGSVPLSTSCASRAPSPSVLAIVGSLPSSSSCASVSPSASASGVISCAVTSGPQPSPAMRQTIDLMAPVIRSGIWLVAKAPMVSATTRMTPRYSAAVWPRSLRHAPMAHMVAVPRRDCPGSRDLSWRWVRLPGTWVPT
jgi:hypothetical protein